MDYESKIIELLQELPEELKEYYYQFLATLVDSIKN